MSAKVYGNLHGFDVLLKALVGKGLTTLTVLSLLDAVSASILSIIEPSDQTSFVGYSIA